MNIKKPALWIALLAICLFAASCAPTTPTAPAGPTAAKPAITLSPEKVLDRGHVEMKGIGFTPKASIVSHLKRPNGTEFPELRILTDEKGEFTHDIDSLLLLEGTHEVWVVDSTGVSSNVATFEVTHGQAPQK